VLVCSCQRLGGTALTELATSLHPSTYEHDGEALRGINFGASGTTCWAALESRLKAHCDGIRIPRSLSAGRVARQCAYLRRRVVRYYLLPVARCPLPVARCPLPVATAPGRWNMSAATPAVAMVYGRSNVRPEHWRLRHWAKEKVLKRRL